MITAAEIREVVNNCTRQALQCRSLASVFSRQITARQRA
jgi:hypothetical protein